MNLQVLYDEKVQHEIQPAPWKPEDKQSCDIFHLRVRLFKGVGIVPRGAGIEEHPVYLLVQDYESYEGDPETFRGPYRHTTKKAFVQGPDSKLIRKAIAIADAFGKRAYDSN